MATLKFSTGNRKMNHMAESMGLKKSAVLAFDLPAGYTCPCASLCKSTANRENGKITDGDKMVFRCYAASLESAFTSVRIARWHNFDLLKNLDESGMVDMINRSLPKNAKIIRIHSSGDFFNKAYFNAWVKVASAHPEISFFGYTKVVQYVSASKPDNFKLVYSFGGLHDNNLPAGIPTAKVVSFAESSICKDEKTAHEDYFEIMAGKSFTLNLHGTQPRKALAIASA